MFYRVLNIYYIYTNLYSSLILVKDFNRKETNFDCFCIKLIDEYYY